MQGYAQTLIVATHLIRKESTVESVKDVPNGFALNAIQSASVIRSGVQIAGKSVVMKLSAKDVPTPNVRDAEILFVKIVPGKLEITCILWNGASVVKSNQEVAGERWIGKKNAVAGLCMSIYQAQSLCLIP